MGRLVQFILRILDGTPQSKPQKRELGQSLVEMALVTPILAVLIGGIIEIGWFANHVLILQEVARVGARSGTVLSGDFDPGNWNNDASIHQDVWTDISAYNVGAGVVPNESLNYRDCDVAADFPGFYNFVACLMLDSMDPLIFVPDNGVDDIVISTFSLMAINNGDYTTVDIDENPNLRRRTHDFDSLYTNGVSMVVVGRYPVDANECTELSSGGPRTNVRDPFNYIPEPPHPAATNGGLQTDGTDPDFPTRQFFVSGGSRIYVEQEGNDSAAEYQRGFVWFAQHLVEDAPDDDTYCYGSEWSIDEVAELLNVPSFLDVNCAADPAPFASTAECNAAKTDRREFLPSQGLTLVEIFWEHDMLLDFPFLNPIILGSDDGRSTISTWSAFPLPSTEPNLFYRSEG